MMMACVVSGCATYRFQKGKAPYDQGYLALRDGYPIAEYTLGAGNAVPADLALAKERFSRRRASVEQYYRRMGYLQSRFYEAFWGPLTNMGKMVTGIFRLPFIARHNYRYDHDLRYREKIRQQQQDADIREQARIKKIQDELKAYVQRDLEVETALVANTPEPEHPLVAKKRALKEKKARQVKEKAAVAEAAPAVTPEPEAAPVPVTPKKEKPPKPLKIAAQKKVVEGAQGEALQAVIIAHPAKGFSPLRVQFSAGNSVSRQGRITAYDWDFGDGDKSTRRNAVNTFLSASYGAREYTVTLTVHDDKGNVASASTVIEVLTR
jgi:hypothetical protein